MNEKYSDITLIVDKSGSMGPLRMDTIGGINTFLAEQQKTLTDKVLFTLIQFNNTSVTTINKADIADVEPLTLADYIPNGGTALLDAVGEAIIKAGRRFARMAEKDRPAKVLFVIITDGEENSSSLYTLPKIKQLIETQQDVYKWQFVFMGANQDSFQTASSYGIYACNVANYSATAEGTANVYGSLSSNVRSFRADTADVVQNRSFFVQPVDGNNINLDCIGVTTTDDTYGKGKASTGTVVKSTDNISYTSK